MLELGFQGTSNDSTTDWSTTEQPPLLNHASVPLNHTSLQLTPSVESIVTVIFRGKKRKVTVTIEDYPEKPIEVSKESK